MTVYHWSARLQNLLFPPHCRLCGAACDSAWSLCAGCEQDLPWLASACTQCARPGPATLRCGHCQRMPPPFDSATALFHYAPPVDYLLKRLKFSSELGIAPLLCALLAAHLAMRAAPLPALLVPVPLHRSRQRERGYNQANLLADRLGLHLAIPVARRLCERRRATAPQSLLGPAARRTNLHRAFIVRRTPPAHIAIVDDVMTTGHTAGELARILKRAGAGRVEVWVIARAAPA